MVVVFILIVFYYGFNLLLVDLQVFDVVVVELVFVCDLVVCMCSVVNGVYQLFVYVLLGEVQFLWFYYKQMLFGLFKGDNVVWGSCVIDQIVFGWCDFFFDKIVVFLWVQGWCGFFFDMLDFYQLFVKIDVECVVQMQVMIVMLCEFKCCYLEVKLIFNCGFELFFDVVLLMYVVVVELFYCGYDVGCCSYGVVIDNDCVWFFGQLCIICDCYCLLVIVIDYVDLFQFGVCVLVCEMVKKISVDGFLFWVVDGMLMFMGVFSVELVLCNVLVLLDVVQGDDLYIIEVQCFLGIQLNYFGLCYEFCEVGCEGLFIELLVGCYVGVVIWFCSGIDYQCLGFWIGQCIKEGVLVVIFNVFGFQMIKFSVGMLGLISFVVFVLEQLEVM